MLVTALASPQLAAAAPATTLNVCAYSHDGSVRDTPVTFTPDATTGTVQQGISTDQVTMPAGRVDVHLPLGFAGGVLGPGLLPLAPRTIPVTAWFAVEAGNAVADRSSAHSAQWVPVATGLDVPVDASQPFAPAVVAGIPVASTAWTAAGGREVALRQATSGALATPPAIPPPPDTTGSLVLRLDLRSWAGGFLTVDCRPGSVASGSGAATAALAKTVATAEPSADGGRYPYAGYDSRDRPLPGDIPGGVDASLAFEPAGDGHADDPGGPAASVGWLPEFGAYNAGVLPNPPEPGQPLRFPAGSRHVLRVTLSAAQRAAWLGPDGPGVVTLGGWVEVAADGLEPATRLIALRHRTWIPSATEEDGSTELEFALPVDGWTATDARVPRRLYPGRMRNGETTGFQEGNSIVLSAAADGTTKGMLLTPGRDITEGGGISTVRMYPGPRAYLTVPPTPAPATPRPSAPGDQDLIPRTPDAENPPVVWT